ncbi:hypothetical protein C8R46DRAFT_1216575 [Mycena filopes]|nr:hypothetical protein C8R46DRAFT_1216575 [Mycena filopes]
MSQDNDLGAQDLRHPPSPSTYTLDWTTFSIDWTLDLDLAWTPSTGRLRLSLAQCVDARDSDVKTLGRKVFWTVRRVISPPLVVARSQRREHHCGRSDGGDLAAPPPPSTAFSRTSCVSVRRASNGACDSLGWLCDVGAHCSQHLAGEQERGSFKAAEQPQMQTRPRKMFASVSLDLPRSSSPTHSATYIANERAAAHSD